jgi:hypothetical protein
MAMNRLILTALLAFSLSLVASFTLLQGASSASAQGQIICGKASSGSASLYMSFSSCPVVANLFTTSDLYKFDPVYFNDYIRIHGTLSGCVCSFDNAFDANPDGSSGQYYTYGQHSVSWPGTNPGFGISYWFFTV